MISWEQYVRGEENAAFGQWLVETIADLYGCEANVKSIERAVYKNTDCGAWVDFDEQGIKVGTIVEGSDAEYSERVDVNRLDDDETGAELISRFRAAIANCEAFAEENFPHEDWSE